jgi:hypothetical protein
MTTQSEYLESLEDKELHLDSPLPLELSGGGKNWVATWIETGIEGEGDSREACIEDARKAILKRYRALEKKLKNSERLKTEEETIWVSMCHYIVDVGRGRVRQGEEFAFGSSRDKDYKGPVFG